MLKEELRPQKLHSLPLRAQIHNFTLLQDSIFLISGCTRKVFVCGAKCQPANLPGVIWPALHTWEVLVVYMFEELRRKQALSSLTETSKQASSSAQRWTSFPPRAFLLPSVLCNVILKPDTKSPWVLFTANLLLWTTMFFQTRQVHCWCQHFMKITLIIPAGNFTWE